MIPGFRVLETTLHHPPVYPRLLRSRASIVRGSSFQPCGLLCSALPEYLLTLSTSTLPLQHVSRVASAVVATSRVQTSAMANRASAAASSHSPPIVLTVAGSDSSSGAGIQADMKACVAAGVWCATVITAVTAQNSHGVRGIYAVPADSLTAQLVAVLGDLAVRVIKVGMLPNAEAVNALCTVVEGLRDGTNEGSPPPTPSHLPLVVDPVLVATSGQALADSSVIEPMKTRLFPLSHLVTPNLREAEALLQLPSGAINSLEDMKEAARKLLALGPRAVLLKGGHLEGEPDAVDVFMDANGMSLLSSPRVSTTHTHGTGCTLASTIAAHLALGLPLRHALQASKHYLSSLLLSSSLPHCLIGSGKQQPLNHTPFTTPWPASSSRAALLSSPSSLLRLYAVTDPRMNAKWGRTMAQAVREAIEGGATFIQIREKDTDTDAFIQAAADALSVCRAAGVPLVINDRVDVALAVGADGVHVGQSDMSAATVRAMLGASRIVGVSVKTVEQAEQAWRDGADYVGCGGVFPTNTKAGNKTIGLEGLQRVCEEAKLPVVAIGGISGANVGQVFKAGAAAAAAATAAARPVSATASGLQGGMAGVAVVSALFDQEDVRAATEKLAKEVQSAVEES